MRGGFRMKRHNFRRRNSLIYKIKFWFYNLTIDDIKKYMKYAFNFMDEFLLVLAFLLLIFIAPAFFH